MRRVRGGHEKYLVERECVGTFAGDRQVSAVDRVERPAEQADVHTLLAISTTSLKTPYAVCSTPGEMDTVPIVPIRSVWSNSRFDVPRADASTSASVRTSARTLTRVPLGPRL